MGRLQSRCLAEHSWTNCTRCLPPSQSKTFGMLSGRKPCLAQTASSSSSSKQFRPEKSELPFSQRKPGQNNQSASGNVPWRP
ncbi:hypothetical protein CRM22_006739 [Opisthorchis felineus]|uniref:Uncharacterized protein n=1 Tax=Opisthorchis felineus TaxID=147828 RepID=A0A4S2LJG6_OPIFE|nr:hypothetical protein CRM22_006739 [Opisthorchis felineus]